MMWWIVGIVFIVLALIILISVFLFSFSLSDLLELDIKSQFKAEDDKEEERKIYFEKKQRQIKQHLENIRQNQQKFTLNYEAGRIVDINKPLGKWTKLVTMTQLKYISNVKKLMGEKFSNKIGFWQMKVKAQSMSQGRERGKGR